MTLSHDPAPNGAAFNPEAADTDYQSSPVRDFLEAVYTADVDSPMPLELDGVLSDVTELSVLANAIEIYAFPVMSNGAAFVFQSIPDATETTLRNCKIKPAAALAKQGNLILVWALDTPVEPEYAETLRLALGMKSWFEAIPAPGTNGWTLIDADPSRAVDLETLLAAYEGTDGEQNVVVETAPVEATSKLKDADVMASLNANGYTEPFTFTMGAHTESKNWKPMTMPLSDFLSALGDHKVGKKDGTAFVLANMVAGKRLKTSVKSLTGVGLDIDTGMPSAKIDEAIEKLGCLAVRYTTHSHNKTTTEFKKDKAVKWCLEHKPGDDFQNPEVLKAFLKFQAWDDSIIESAVFEGEHHTDKGIIYRIVHNPMAKNRLVFILKEPFEIAKEGALQADAMKKWAKVPTALAAKMGLPLDTSCTDPSRLFYFPRHDEGKPFESKLFTGDFLDWRSLTLDLGDKLLAEASKGKGKSSTSEGKALGRWSIKAATGFQIADVVEDYAPDRLRGSASQGFNIECPFDEDHSNAGDTDDRACFVVNAGMGVSEVFTISCRHESCRDKTNLDMLGKMITDGWFPREVIEDEQYIATVMDEGGNETAPKTLPVLGQDERPRGVYYDSEKLIQDLKPHVSVLLDGGVRLIIEKGESFEIVPKADAMVWFENVRLEVEVKQGKKENKSDSKFKIIPGLPIYMQAVDRIEFQGITNDPTVPRREGPLYGTWRGFERMPNAGNWTLLRAHLKDVICSGDEVLFDWHMGWMAQMFQHPECKTGTAIVLRGPKKAGKSTIGYAIRRVIGKRHSMKVSQQTHVTGHFNDHLRDCLFLQIEEGVWGGNKTAEGVLKDLVTGETLTIEAKFAPARELLNFSRLFITSNEDWVIPATKGERRFFVLDVEDKFEGLEDDDPARAAYFDPLYFEIDNGGAEAMVADLLNYDYSHLNLRQPPVTEGLRKQIAQSLTDDQNWLLEAITQGYFADRHGRLIEGSDEWPLDDELEIQTSHLLESFRDHVSTYNNSAAPLVRMLKILGDHGALRKKRLTVLGKREHGYVLAKRSEWQKRFADDYKHRFEPEEGGSKLASTAILQLGQFRDQRTA